MPSEAPIDDDEKTELIDAVENDPAIDNPSDAKRAVERHTANELYTTNQTPTTDTSNSFSLRSSLSSLLTGIADTFYKLDVYSISTATAKLRTDPEQDKITLTYSIDQTPLNNSPKHGFKKSFALNHDDQRGELNRLINHLPNHITEPAALDNATIPIRYNHRRERPEIDIPPAELWNRPQYYIGRIKRRLNVLHDNKDRNHNHAEGQRVFLFNALCLSPAALTVHHIGITPEPSLPAMILAFPAIYCVIYAVIYLVFTIGRARKKLANILTLD